MSETVNIRELNDLVAGKSNFISLVTQGMNQTIVGQKHLVDSLLIALLSNGHILLEGVPGLAKTLAIKTLAQVIDAKYSRIQFTPDLLPADVTSRRSSSRLRKAPYLPTSYSPTRLTVLPPRCRARYSRPCKNVRSPSVTTHSPFRSRFL